MAKNTELVSKDDLDALNKLNTEIDTSIQKLGGLLTEATKVEKEFSKITTSYKGLIDAIDKFNQISTTSNNVVGNQQRLLDERARVLQRIANNQSDYGRETQRLNMDLQRLTRTQRNQIIEQNSATGSINQMRARLNLLRQEYDSLGRDARRANTGLRNEIRSLHDEILRLESATGRSQRNVGNYFGSFAKGVLSFVGITGALSLLRTGLTDAVNKIRSFEKANTVLAGILGENKKDIKDLSASAIDLGKSSKYTASQVTELQTELAKLGFTRQEIKDSQQYILMFATALDASLGDAASLAGASIRAFGASTQETERYVSAMTVAANRSALSFEYLSTAMPIVAPVAKAFNFTIEDTLALLGNLSDSGFDASMAATSLRNIFLNLADSNGKLAKTLGGPVTNLEELVKGFKSLRDRGIDLATSLELTDKRSVAAFQTFLQGADKLVPLRDSLIGVGDELQKIAEDQMDNLDGSTLKLKSSWEGLMLSFSGSSGVMKNVVDGLTWIVNKLNEGVDAIGYFYESSKYPQFISNRKTIYTEQYEKQLMLGVEGQKESFFKPEAERSSYDKTSAQNYAKVVEENYKKERERLENELNKYITVQKDIQKDFDEASKPFFRLPFKPAELKSQLNDATVNVDTARASLEAFNDAYKNLITPKENEQGNTKTGKGITLADPKEEKKAADALKKRMDAERKASQELSVYEIEQSAAKQKKILSDTLSSYEDRIKAANEYENKLGEAINKKRNNELSNIEKQYKDGEITERTYRDSISLINLKSDAELTKISEEGGKAREDILKGYIEKQQQAIEKYYSDTENIISDREQQELKALSGLYASGSIKQEDYEKKKTEIAKRYAKERFDAEIATLRAMLEISNMTPEQKAEIEKKILDAELRYNQYINDQEVKSAEDAAKKKEDIEKISAGKRKKILEDLYKETFDMIGAFQKADSERALEKLDKEKEDNETWRDNELKGIDRLEQSGAISKEQADARKAEIDSQAQQREQNIEEKRKQIQREQAQSEKRMALFQAVINTAAGITKAFPNLILMALVGALGAVQIATISAQHIPEYAKGTNNHKGGLAVLGDGGRSEMVVTPSGSVYKTPSYPVVWDLPKNSMVMPDFEKALPQLSMTPLAKKRDDSITIFDNKEQLKLLKNVDSSLNQFNRSNNMGNQAIQRTLIKMDNNNVRHSKNYVTKVK